MVINKLILWYYGMGSLRNGKRFIKGNLTPAKQSESQYEGKNPEKAPP